MKTASYEEISSQLDDALAFCASAGLADDANSSRFTTYRASIARLVEATRAARPSPISEQVESGTLPHLIAIIETSEFISLLPFLRSCDPDVLRAQHTNIHPLAQSGSLDERVFRAFGAALEGMWNTKRN